MCVGAVRSILLCRKWYIIYVVTYINNQNTAYSLFIGKAYSMKGICKALSMLPHTKHLIVKQKRSKGKTAIFRKENGK